MMILRDYQQDILQQLLEGSTNDCVQLDTGAGKTPILASYALQSPRFLAVAHRNMLIEQLSESLARHRVRHNIAASRTTKARCVARHKRSAFDSWYDASDKDRFVVSIDTLLSQFKRQRLGISTDLTYDILIDECHHALEDNKWGLLRKLFPRARFIGFTATPFRFDGRSLHSDDGGLFDRLVQASSLRENSYQTLANKGYLSGFRAYVAPKEADVSRPFDDYLWAYKRLADGKRAVYFCPSIKNAAEVAERFQRAGIPATHISSDMTNLESGRRLDLFASGRIKVIANFDMIGEGYDLPEIEAIGLLRPVYSFGQYRQYLGRVLRASPGKPHGIIIDHVGNVLRHGLPSDPVEWDLRRPPSGKQTQNLVHCEACYSPYHGWLSACPECGAPNDMHRRRTVGGFYIDQASIDWSLCEYRRAEDERIKTEAAYQQRLQTEIVPVPLSFAGGSVGQLCMRLADWFCQSLIKHGVPILDVNEFTHSPSYRKMDFYISNFTIADLKSDGKKAVKVLQKWQKSR